MVEDIAAGESDFDSALRPDTIGLLEGLCTTRAVRRYRDEPVPQAALRDMLFAATRAPSGSNRQPFRFIVLTDSEVAAACKALIGAAARDAWRAKRGRDGYGEGSGRDASSAKARMAHSMDDYVEHFEAIPALILPCLVRYRPSAPAEGASIYPACQNLLLAARALGYGGVMTHWHALVDDAVHDLLGIPPEVFIAATITVGRPMGSQGPVRRRPLKELVFMDGWNRPAPFAIDPPGTRFTSAGPPTSGVGTDRPREPIRPTPA
jgi:nitroreductase